MCHGPLNLSTHLVLNFCKKGASGFELLAKHYFTSCIHSSCQGEFSMWTWPNKYLP